MKNIVKLSIVGIMLISQALETRQAQAKQTGSKEHMPKLLQNWQNEHHYEVQMFNDKE